MSSHKHPSFLSDFNKYWILCTDFLKTLKYRISIKSVPWQPSCSMRTDGRTRRIHQSLCAIFRTRLQSVTHLPRHTLHLSKSSSLFQSPHRRSLRMCIPEDTDVSEIARNRRFDIPFKISPPCAVFRWHRPRYSHLRLPLQCRLSSPPHLAPPVNCSRSTEVMQRFDSSWRHFSQLRICVSTFCACTDCRLPPQCNEIFVLMICY